MYEFSYIYFQQLGKFRELCFRIDIFYQKAPSQSGFQEGSGLNINYNKKGKLTTIAEK